jgi:tetratricopeptide (TPR) repeat protein
MSDVQAELDELMERTTKLDDQRRFKSMLPLVREGLQKSKETRDFDRYMSFLFQAVRRAHLAHEPEAERDGAIEMISLLESEDNARRLQPDLDDDAYEDAKFWYTSCAYDRLAGATMAMSGCNSEGMFGAIEAGVDVCHMTGKTRCVVCFRENGVDTSIAADDLEIAMNQALWLAHRNQEDVQHDRRVLGWRRVAHIKMLEGDPRTALRATDPAWEAAAEYHDPDDARLRCHRVYETACILLGEPEAYTAWSKDHPRPKQPPRGESLGDDCEDDRLEALRAAAAGDHAKVESLLGPWLQEFDRLKHLLAWFEVARQLYASRVTAGRPDAEPLAEELLARSGPAREWLNDRLVRAYRDPEFTPNPYGTIFPMLEGPWRDKLADQKQKDTPTAAEAPAAGPAAEATPELTELQKQVDAWRAELHEAETTEPVLERVEKALLAMETGSLQNADDACAWLQAATWLAHAGRQGKTLWQTAGKLRRRFSDNAMVLTLAADVGDLLRQAEGEVEVRPSEEDVEPIYRQALALDPMNAVAHYSAGRFYEDAGNMSEAERCFARAFRLDRVASPPVLAVARVYRATGRPRDALEALDVAIRHGCGDQRVFYEATIDSFELDAWDRCISYGAAVVEHLPDAPGIRYYMALAQLHLEQWQDAIKLIDEEARLSPEAVLQVHSVHALAYAGMDQGAEAAAAIESALTVPLPGVDYMSLRGLSTMLETQLKAAEKLGDAAMFARVERRARRAGVLHERRMDEYRLREENEESDNLALYQVTIRQPLPDDHDADPDTPYWELGWKDYIVYWTALAESEEQAVELALEQQRMAADLPPEVVNVESDGNEYATKPGVVEDSPRHPPSES